MNKAITDGVVFMPPAFAMGLDQWSSGDGTPGSDSYQGAGNAALVAADQDFGGALELTKSQTTQKLRHFGETPILPGCYLQVRARVKAVSGNFPTLRIAAWAGGAGNQHVTGVTEIGPEVTLSSYGEVVEISAIVGVGQRSGVDMAWGPGAIYGHFGLDMTGPNGGVVRIDDIEIEDITAAFRGQSTDWVDVRDYGAVGDGTTDNHAAFEAADAAAQGRDVLVPDGVYRLGDSVTLQSRVRFQGTVTMAADKILSLNGSYDLPSYIDAFGDEELGFRKAFQALLNNSGHESLDLCGRLITLTEPVDMQAAVVDKDNYSQRRYIKNGQFSAHGNGSWATEVVTSQASYSLSDSLKLTNVTNVANIPLGAVIEGTGVGREVYVAEVDVAQQEITLSQQLYDAEGTQVFTFRRFKYLLDFSGFVKLSKFSLSNIEFQCSGVCSGVMLPGSGTGFHFRDCFITRPKDRGITSYSKGDQGMIIDRCQFLSDESDIPALNRVSIGLNANANDVKLRDNRASYFRHFALLAGSSNIVTSNHWFQGDTSNDGGRTAGLILTRTNSRSTVTSNYIDNCFVEWVNEHDSAPDYDSEFSFSALNLSDNVFLAGNVAPWFTFLVIKPHGAGHYLNGLNINNNSFRIIGGSIAQVEHVDTSFADFDYNRMKGVNFTSNTYNNIEKRSESPFSYEFSRAGVSNDWSISLADHLPFEGWAQAVESVVAMGPLTNGAGQEVFAAPYVHAKQGASQNEIRLRWPEPVQGTVILRARMDDVH